MRLELKRKQSGEAMASQPPDKKKKESITKFDKPYNHDATKPLLLEFYPDYFDVVPGSIAALIGLRRINGVEISMATDARRPHTTFPYYGQLGGAYVGKQEFVPEILRSKLLGIGIFPIPGFYPQAQIIGLDDKDSTSWPPADVNFA